MEKTDPRIAAALLKTAKQQEQNPTLIAQQYLSALEEPALRIFCALIRSEPKEDLRVLAHKAWNAVAAFGSEKMNAGERLIDSLNSSKRD